MNKKNFIALCMAVTLSTGVAWSDDDNHMNYVTQNIDNIGYFENIISNASFDIEFTQRNEQTISVYGDPQQVDNVNLTLMGKTLVVGNKENTQVSRVKVIITAPDLLCVVAGGSGDVDVKNLNNESFTATLSGSGDIEITGSCDKAEYSVNGSGDIDADEFRVEYLDATVNGSGSIECRCTDTLNANVVGSGEIEIKGPTRMVNRAGRKSAIRHDH